MATMTKRGGVDPRDCRPKTLQHTTRRGTRYRQDTFIPRKKQSTRKSMGLPSRDHYFLSELSTGSQQLYKQQKAEDCTRAEVSKRQTKKEMDRRSSLNTGPRRQQARLKWKTLLPRAPVQNQVTTLVSRHGLTNHTMRHAVRLTDHATRATTLLTPLTTTRCLCTSCMGRWDEEFGSSDEEGDTQGTECQQDDPQQWPRQYRPRQRGPWLDNVAMPYPGVIL